MYKDRDNANDADKYILSVKFDISRFGDHTKCLYFKEPKTEFETLKEIEKFLSKPLTVEYYNKIKDDLTGDFWDEWTDDKANLIRGDVLGDATFYEGFKKIDFNSSHYYYLIIGS